MPRVTVNRVELHYEDEGEGRPVVFLHGVWMSSRFFDRQRAYFGARHRYLALDFRGHGQSEQVHEGHMLPQYGRDLRGFLAAPWTRATQCSSDGRWARWSSGT
jgi:pimeloyl-ACP methyl ester carboxylesterase